MTFFEVLTKISERGEKVISDKCHVIQTDKHLYARASDGGWVEKELPTPVPIPAEISKNDKK